MSEKEGAQLTQALTNLKYKTILYLTYLAGLRVDEIVRLRYSDLDIERQTIIVRQGKDHKDRRTLLYNLTWNIVQKYIAEYRPDRWFFPGQSSDRHLTERSVQKVFEEARQRAGIVKKMQHLCFVALFHYSFAGKRNRSVLYTRDSRSYECTNNATICTCQHEKHSAYSKPAGS